MKENRIEEFRACINRNCSLTEDDMQEVVRIDLEMPPSYVYMDLLTQMDLLEPYGVGNRKPIFASKNIRFIRARKLGKTGKARIFVVEDSYGKRNEMIHFGEESECIEQFDAVFGSGKLNALYQGEEASFLGHILYYSNINEYRGRKSIQNVLTDYKNIN